MLGAFGLNQVDEPSWVAAGWMLGAWVDAGSFGAQVDGPSWVAAGWMGGCWELMLGARAQVDEPSWVPWMLGAVYAGSLGSS
jgi:hypothetical protein